MLIGVPESESIDLIEESPDVPTFVRLRVLRPSGPEDAECLATLDSADRNFSRRDAQRRSYGSMRNLDQNRPACKHAESADSGLFASGLPL